MPAYRAAWGPHPDASGYGEGLLVGANLGAFFRVSDALSLGGLVNFDS